MEGSPGSILIINDYLSIIFKKIFYIKSAESEISKEGIGSGLKSTGRGQLSTIYGKSPEDFL
jgi:hypothetical protein